VEEAMSTFAFVGPPGSGKTTMTASACDLGYTVHVVDTDKKLKDMANVQKYLKSGQLTYWCPKSPLVAETLAERAKSKTTDSKGNITFSYPKKQPEGYIEIAEYINSLTEKPPVADIIALDSFTRMCDHLKRFMLFLTRRAHFEYSDWDSWFIQLNEFTEVFLTLPYQHHIITYHDKIVRDELTGQIRMPVAVDGQYSDAVGRYFSEMYAFETDIEKDKAVYRIRTVPDKKRAARSSYGLDTYMPATFKNILPIKAKEGGDDNGNT